MALTGTAALVMEAIHAADIYEGFEPSRPLDLQGWNGGHPAFARAVEEVRPNLAIDVGVWKGQSTVTLARAMRALQPEAAVISVDSFLGSPEHWNPAREDRIMDSLGLRHGWPHLYWQFLSNLVHAGVADMVVPLPQTSENAAVILRQRRIRADLVHIDAAHEYEPVLRDTRAFWELLRPGGILMGDDWTWPGVRRAAEEFAAEKGLELEVSSPKWVLRKPR